MEPDGRTAVAFRDGYLIIPGALDAHSVARALVTMRSLPEPFVISDASSVGDKRWMIPLDLVPPFDDPIYWCNPKIHPVLSSLLGEDYQMANFGCVCVWPGATRQHAHRDGGTGLFPGTDIHVVLPPYAITVVYALIDSASTSLQVGDATVTPSLAAGDCMIWDFRMWHWGEMWQGEEMRPLLYITACRPWFRDDLNGENRMPMHASPELRERVAPADRHLLERVRWTL